MNRRQANAEFLKSIFDLTDGTTIKVVKGDKTLIEIDGSVISGVMNIVEKYDQLDEFDDSRYPED